MRTVPVLLGGVTYHLLLNGAALFDLYDKFGDKGSLADHLQGSGRTAFDNTCAFLTILTEQGELWRRYLGYGHGPLPTTRNIRDLISRSGVGLAKIYVMRALISGLHQDYAEKPKMMDKGLQSLQEKTGNGLTRGKYLQITTQILGLDVREALLLPVGLVFDMLELERQRRDNGKKGA